SLPERLAKSWHRPYAQPECTVYTFLRICRACATSVVLSAASAAELAGKTRRAEANWVSWFNRAAGVMPGSGPISIRAPCSATGHQMPDVYCRVWRWVIQRGLSGRVAGWFPGSPGHRVIAGRPTAGAGQSGHGPGEVTHAYPVAGRWRRCRPPFWPGLSCRFGDLGRHGCQPGDGERVMRGAAGDAPARRVWGRHLLGVAVLAVAVAAAVLPRARGAGPAPARPGAPALRWAGCGNGSECATAAVPLDYDHPGGPAISLALIRLPATGQAHRIGSLPTNPGGPGLSGVTSIRSIPPSAYPPGIRARFDIVG